ncbi:MAG: ABC transporter ATP-binding protein/permease [Oscillospiraceae bacterium]|nr:ABC transporter ATP-binding protein/permease [Oscillospiraceae bacterium]
MKKIKYHLPMIKRGILTLMQIEKPFVILHIIIEIISQFAPYITIYMSARIIDELIGNQNVNTLILYILITIGANMILSLLINGLTHLKNYHQEQFYKNETMNFSEKTMSMDYENTENRDINLLRERINTESRTGYNIYNLYTALGNFVGAVINIVLAITLTLSLFANREVSLISKLIMLAMIAGIIIVNYFTANKRSKLYLNMYEDAVPLNAMFHYYAGFYSNYNAGKDIRLYSMEEFIREWQQQFYEKNNNLLITLIKKVLKHDIIYSVSSNALRIAAYIFVMLACVAGSVTVGSIAMYVSCIVRVIGAATGLVTYGQTLIVNNKYLEHYFKYLDIPSKMYQGTLPVEKRDDNEYEIEFRNVSFKYPGTNTYALKNLSMKLNIGQRLAVVGMNGSGKTTMIKLLCRLYDPTEGEITLNGFNIKKYNYDEYMSIFSVVFQDFKLFSFPLGQNVASSSDYDGKRTAECLKMSGFDARLDNMPKGLETALYKDFEEDGVEISGGEAQKIALARALYKDAPFIVLDEPTAALDPIAEFEVYSKFNEIVGGKTAIYISHRLSSCRFCDDIAVFHEGELIQRGSHDTLITDASGKYCELWNAQAQYYAENKENKQ